MVGLKFTLLESQRLTKLISRQRLRFRMGRTVANQLVRCLQYVETEMASLVAAEDENAISQCPLTDVVLSYMAAPLEATERRVSNCNIATLTPS